MSKLYNYFKEEKNILNKNEDDERKKFKNELLQLRMDDKDKDKRIDELFIENKKLSTANLSLQKNSSNLSEVNTVLEEKSSNIEKK